MGILFLSALSNGSGDFSGRIKSLSGNASYRLQLAPAFRCAHTLGLKPRLFSLDIDKPELLERLGSPKVCIVFKINHHDDHRAYGFNLATTAAIARLKAGGTHISVAYCDNLAPLDDCRGAFYRYALQVADSVVVPSRRLQILAKQYASSNALYFLNEDPWQVMQHPFRTLSSKLIKIGWFGSVSNGHFLFDILQNVLLESSSQNNYQLRLLGSSTTINTLRDEFSRVVNRFKLTNWELLCTKWDSRQQPNQLEEFLQANHIILLPSDPLCPIKNGVSHNRLIDSIRSGCITVASPMDSYIELKKLCILTNDFPLALNTVISQYNRLSHKYSTTSTQIMSRFSPSSNHERWKKILTSLTAQVSLV